MTLAGPALDAAFQRRLQRLVGRVVIVEGQVVAKQDEAVGAFFRMSSAGQRVDVFAVDLDQLQRLARPALIAACAALTSDDLPMPRAPHSSTLLAGRPRRTASVLSTGCRGRGRRPDQADVDAVDPLHRFEPADSASQTKQSAASKGRKPAQGRGPRRLEAFDQAVELSLSGLVGSDRSWLRRMSAILNWSRL
jgi:hypothetical protein